MLWELLVTEGHVRAARLRQIMRPLLLIACVLMVVGGYGLVYSPPLPSMGLQPEITLNRKTAETIQPPLQKFYEIPPLYMTQAQLKDLAGEKEITTILDRIRQSLNTSNEAPSSSQLEYRVSKVEDFWSWNWGSDLLYLNAGDTRAFGGNFSRQSLSSTEPNSEVPVGAVRWLGIFKKSADGWKDVAVEAPGFVIPPEEKHVLPKDIPLSLRVLMGLPEFPE